MQTLYIVFTSLLLTVSGCTGESEKTGATNVETISQEGKEVATFAGGCFWCTEAVFERIKGVEDVVSGYTGGNEKNPTYQQVSYGETDHAEAVQIYYDPNVITYQKLLEIFFVAHHPTQANGQGPDIGHQYRPEIFYHNDTQKKLAEAYIKKLNASGEYNQPIATKVTAYKEFWLAEDYHQNYYELNPGNPYIINIAVPKVKKVKKHFPDLIKDKYAVEN